MVLISFVCSVVGIGIVVVVVVVVGDSVVIGDGVMGVVVSSSNPRLKRSSWTLPAIDAETTALPGLLALRAGDTVLFCNF